MHKLSTQLNPGLDALQKPLRSIGGNRRHLLDGRVAAASLDGFVDRLKAAYGKLGELLRRAITIHLDKHPLDDDAEGQAGACLKQSDFVKLVHFPLRAGLDNRTIAEGGAAAIGVPGGLA